jgi:hypothetical protein
VKIGSKIHFSNTLFWKFLPTDSTGAHLLAVIVSHKRRFWGNPFLEKSGKKFDSSH